MGKVVEFSAKMKPSARFTLEDSKGKHVASNAGVMLRIVTMSREERIELLSAGADDPVLVLFAMLTPTERKEVIQAAETFLKTKVR